MQNLTAIVWLHREQPERFLQMVGQYGQRVWAEANAVEQVLGVFQAIVQSAINQMQAYANLIASVAHTTDWFVEDSQKTQAAL